MNNPFATFLSQLNTHPFETVIAAVASICTILFIGAVAKSFRQYHGQRKVKREKRSPVNTVTMFLFFFFYLWLLQQRLLTLPLTNIALKVQQTFGALLLIFSTVVNILGRNNLGKQWGDQIRLYNEHIFVQTGWYRVVRHPLYASTIWALIAGSLIYNNGGALLATIAVFIPMMRYRANQEETLLTERFPEYRNYQKSIGQLFPKVKWR